MGVLILFILFLSTISVNGSRSSPNGVDGSNALKTHYIVYMGQHSFQDSNSVISANHKTLALAMDSSHEAAQDATVHHYYKSFRGFSAMLTQEQADRLAEDESVVSIFESKLHHLQTTRSWDFLEESSNGQFKHISLRKKYDVVIGHLDGGVWPESKSFSPKNLGRMPARFKGACVTGENFTATNCNGKIIGARYYSKGMELANGPLESAGKLFFRSARDDYGHGTHTASTAAGSVVANINYPGIGSSVSARGGAPGARIAVYKVCWFNLCSAADVLSAFDDAISDGVDIITMSLSPNNFESYFSDVYTIGAFHAFRAGILVVAAAGNDGSDYSIKNPAPWVITVAAGSIDREFNTYVQLGNSKYIKGYGVNEKKGEYSLLAASSASRRGVKYQQASFCFENTLDSGRIHGTMVVCYAESSDDSVDAKASVVAEAGGIGMIVITPYGQYEPCIYDIPTIFMGVEEGQELIQYLNNAEKPTVRVHDTRANLNHKPAPTVALFSSKGPSSITPDIIKPDIMAPGLNILAAVPPKDYVVKSVGTSYNLDSGTSMATPHVAGVAALIKALNKGFGPAAIKSAIMTTASVKDNTGGPIRSGDSYATPFHMGSGHLNPDKALMPGLIYDMNDYDAADFLCTIGVSTATLQKVFGMENLYCKYPMTAQYNLNYPSIGISRLDRPTSVYRTLTFKGKRKGHSLVFKATVEVPEGVDVNVVPSELNFDNTKQAKFRVDIVPRIAMGRYVYGSITWTNGYYNIRSPIALNVV